MIIPRLKKLYGEKIIPEIQKKFKLTNRLAVPKLLKIVLNMSTKDIISNPKIINNIYNDLYLISGQMPIITKSKKSIAAFKLRKGINIGVKVTLRKVIMYEFLDRLINIALPRIRDFKGLNIKNFDKNGNYSFGIKEQIVFPEIDYNNTSKIRGLNITIETSTKINCQARFLLEKFNFPFI